MGRPVQKQMRFLKFAVVVQILCHLVLLANCQQNQSQGLEDTDLGLGSLSESSVEEVHSTSKIRTCCSLDLSLGEDACKPSRDRRPSLLRQYTFSRNVMAENVSTVFPLETAKLSCRLGSPTKIYLANWPNADGTYKLLKNGYLKADKEFYPPAEYCINAKNDTIIEILVCNQTCDGSGGRPCIKKCCSLDKVYSFGVNPVQMGKGCQVAKGDYFKPQFYEDYVSKSSAHIPDPHFTERYPKSSFQAACPHNRTVFYLFPEAAELFSQKIKRTFHGLVYRVREDGKIVFKNSKDGKCSVVDIDHYCIDGVVNYGKPGLNYFNNDREMVMFLCPLPATTENVEVKRVFGLIYGSVMLISSIFLLLTIATYVGLWERQSIHGWTIVSHVVSLFFMYIFLGIAHIVGVTKGHGFLGTRECIGIGIITHFFFLSTFCWLFLISVDLWRTFRAFTPRSGQRSKGFRRYIVYSIFGWGIPLIFVIVGVILDNRYPEDECHTLLTPAYGKDSCFPQPKALGVYLYYPLAAMIVLNLIFFAITTSKLYLYRQSTKMATKDDKQAQFYRLFLKLFFIMGVLWVFEVISWATSGNGYHWFWIVFDMLNVLRALAVFIIFVCKRDIIFALEEKYPCLKPVLLPFAWLFKRRHSSRDDNASMMTRTSTLRQTVSTDGKPNEFVLNNKKESIGLIQNPNNGVNQKACNAEYDTDY